MPIHKRNSLSTPTGEEKSCTLIGMNERHEEKEKEEEAPAMSYTIQK
jgi:hypothetical protein